MYRFYDRYTHGASRQAAAAHRQEAVETLQTQHHRLTDSATDMWTVLRASAGLIPARVVLRGRPVVLDWIFRAFRGKWFSQRLPGLMQMLVAAATQNTGAFLFAAGAEAVHDTRMAPGSRRPGTTVPAVPPGLRTRAEWVATFPKVLEAFLTDPETGERRKTVDRYLLAKSPYGAALLRVK